MSKETVLVVGSTGNIGVGVTIASLRTGRKVLAVVRNQSSADKLFQHVGTKDGITTVEADVTAEDGLQGVVDQVRAGKLPAFQHVYSTVGTMTPTSPIYNVTNAEYHTTLNIAIGGNFFAYRATVPYLIEQGYKDSTWTLMSGAAGTSGWAGITAVSQGALFSLAAVASRENAKTNIRFNEVYLAFRVDYDSVAKEKGGVVPSSEFGRHYEELLERREIEACRVSLLQPGDVRGLRFESKLK